VISHRNKLRRDCEGPLRHTTWISLDSVFRIVLTLLKRRDQSFDIELELPETNLFLWSRFMLTIQMSGDEVNRKPWLEDTHSEYCVEFGELCSSVPYMKV
jgi:hypothetical protein